MKKIIVLFIHYCLFTACLFAQSSGRQYEYWFDDDFANRISNNLAGTTIDGVADASSLTLGVHRFNFRVQDAGSEWSATQCYTFFRADKPYVAEGNNKIAGYYYWLDNEKRTYVSVDPVNPFVEDNLIIQLDTLTLPANYLANDLAFRVDNLNGNKLSANNLSYTFHLQFEDLMGNLTDEEIHELMNDTEYTISCDTLKSNVVVSVSGNVDSTYCFCFYTKPQMSYTINTSLDVQYFKLYNSRGELQNVTTENIKLRTFIPSEEGLYYLFLGGVSTNDNLRVQLAEDGNYALSDFSPKFHMVASSDSGEELSLELLGKGFGILKEIVLTNRNGEDIVISGGGGQLSENGNGYRMTFPAIKPNTYAIKARFANGMEREAFDSLVVAPYMQFNASAVASGNIANSSSTYYSDYTVSSPFHLNFTVNENTTTNINKIWIYNNFTKGDYSPLEVGIDMMTLDSLTIGGHTYPINTSASKLPVNVTLQNGDEVEITIESLVQTWDTHSVWIIKAKNGSLLSLNSAETKTGAIHFSVSKYASASIPTGEYLYSYSANLNFQYPYNIWGTYNVNVQKLYLYYDSEAPVSKMNKPAVVSASHAVTLSWTATDNASGVASYDLWIKKGEEDYQKVLSASKETSYTFTYEPEVTYEYKVCAIDNAGNVEKKDVADFTGNYGNYALGIEAYSNFKNPVTGSGWYNANTAMVGEGMSYRIVASNSATSGHDLNECWLVGTLRTTPVGAPDATLFRLDSLQIGTQTVVIGKKGDEFPITQEINGKNVTIEFSLGSNVAKWHLQTDGTSPLLPKEDGTLNGTVTFDFTVLGYPGTYSKVDLRAGFYAEAQSDDTDPSAYILSDVLVNQKDVTAPTSNATSATDNQNRTATFSWTGSDSQSGIYAYKIEMANNENQTKGLSSGSGSDYDWQTVVESTTETTYTFDYKYGVTYYYRVIATDNAGNQESKTYYDNSFYASARSHRVIASMTSASGRSYYNQLTNRKLDYSISFSDDYDYVVYDMTITEQLPSNEYDISTLSTDSIFLGGKKAENKGEYWEVILSEIETVQIRCVVDTTSVVWKMTLVNTPSESSEPPTPHGILGSLNSGKLYFSVSAKDGLGDGYELSNTAKIDMDGSSSSVRYTYINVSAIPSSHISRVYIDSYGSTESVNIGISCSSTSTVVPFKTVNLYVSEDFGPYVKNSYSAYSNNEINVTLPYQKGIIYNFYSEVIDEVGNAEIKEAKSEYTFYGCDDSNLQKVDLKKKWTDILICPNPTTSSEHYNGDDVDPFVWKWYKCTLDANGNIETATIISDATKQYYYVESGLEAGSYMAMGYYSSENYGYVIVSNVYTVTSDAAPSPSLSLDKTVIGASESIKATVNESIFEPSKYTLSVFSTSSGSEEIRESNMMINTTEIKGLASGVYIVTLREGGKIIEKTRILVK